MPYKSKAQWRKFFVEAQKKKEGKKSEPGLTMARAKEWAHETKKPYKKLPERKKTAMNARTAQILGRLAALDDALNREKTASPWATALRFGAPAAAGYYLAGPGYRTEGALGGALAGLAGPALARSVIKHMNPELAAAVGKSGGPKTLAEALQMARGGKTIEGVSNIPAIQKQLALGEQWVGPIGLGAAGGYGAGRLLGLQNPYGLQPVFPGYGRENPYGMRPE